MEKKIKDLTKKKKKRSCAKAWTKWPSMVGLLRKKPKRVGLLTQA